MCVHPAPAGVVTLGSSREEVAERIQEAFWIKPC